MKFIFKKVLKVNKNLCFDVQMVQGKVFISTKPLKIIIIFFFFLIFSHATTTSSLDILHAESRVLFDFLQLNFHLFAHQVVAHGNDAHAEQEIHKIDDQLRLFPALGVQYICTGHEITEANFAQTRHAEIQRIEVAPFFPLRKHDCAGGDVA